MTHRGLSEDRPQFENNECARSAGVHRCSIFQVACHCCLIGSACRTPGAYWSAHVCHDSCQRQRLTMMPRSSAARFCIQCRHLRLAAVTRWRNCQPRKTQTKPRLAVLPWRPCSRAHRLLHLRLQPWVSGLLPPPATTAAACSQQQQLHLILRGLLCRHGMCLVAACRQRRSSLWCSFWS